MGWIIGTCILGVLLLVAMLAIIILYFLAKRRIKELEDENRDKSDEIEELRSDIDKGNKYIEDRNIIIREKNRIIDKLNLKLAQQSEIVDRLSNIDAPQPIMEQQNRECLHDNVV